MKRKFKYLFLITVVFSFASCVEFLDRSPDSVAFTDDEIFTDAVYYRNYVNQLLVRFSFFDDNDWNGDSNSNPAYNGTHGKGTYGLRERISDNCYPAENKHWFGLVSCRYGFGGDDGEITSGSNDFNERAGARYDTFWKGIRICNLAIINIDRLTNGTQADKNYILGLAHFCRAHFHFMLCQGWGGMPYLTEPLDPAGEMDFERLSYTETCQKIAEDFETAVTYLPERVDRFNFGYPTKIGAKALKAKALIWAASPFANPGNDLQLWRNAAAAAGEVIALAENSGGYHGLVPMADWKKLFLECEFDIVTKENLYGRYYDRWTGRNHPMQIPSTDQAWGGGGGVDVPQENLAMCFPWSNGEPINPNSAEYQSEPFEGWGKDNGGHDGRDKRFYQTFLYNGAVHQFTSARNRNVEIWHQSLMGETPRDMPGQDVVNGAENYQGSAITGYYCYKSFTEANTFNRMESYARLAEIYLWYAEAANRAWGPTGAPQGTSVSHTAIDALNKVRVRAELPPISADASESWLRPGTTQEFEDVIRNEIRIETAFEEKRFYDLRRWRLMQDPKVMIPLKLFILQNADGTFTYTQQPMGMLDRYNDKWLERHYLFRIKLKDTRIGTKFVQNPGW